MVDSLMQLPHLSCLPLLLLEEGYLLEGSIVVSRSVVLERCLAPRLDIPVRDGGINNISVGAVSGFVTETQIPYGALALLCIFLYVHSPVVFI